MADEQSSNFSIKGYDDTRDAVESATKGMGAIERAAHSAMGSMFTITVGAQDSMVRLANATNATKERVKEMYTEIERLAGKTGFGVEALNDSMRNFASRSGLKGQSLSAVFNDIANAASISGTTVDAMANGALSAMRTMKVPIEDSVGLFSGMASAIGENSKVIMANLDRVALSLANLGLTGKKPLEEFAIMAQLAGREMGNTEVAVTSLNQVFTNAGNIQSALGRNVAALVVRWEDMKGSSKDLIEMLLKQWKTQGALENTVIGRDIAQSIGLPPDVQQAMIALDKKWKNMSEAEREYEVLRMQAAEKQKNIEKTTMNQLRDTGLAIGEAALEVGGLINQFAKLIGVGGGLKSFTEGARALADVLKEVNNMIEGLEVKWSKFWKGAAGLGAPTKITGHTETEGVMGPDMPVKGHVMPFDDWMNKKQDELLDALQKNTDALLKALGLRGQGGPTASPIAFTPGVGEAPWPKTAQLTMAGLRTYSSGGTSSGAFISGRSPIRFPSSSVGGTSSGGVSGSSTSPMSAPAASPTPAATASPAASPAPAATASPAASPAPAATAPSTPSASTPSTSTPSTSTPSTSATTAPPAASPKKSNDEVIEGVLAKLSPAMRERAKPYLSGLSADEKEAIVSGKKPISALIDEKAGMLSGVAKSTVGGSYPGGMEGLQKDVTTRFAPRPDPNQLAGRPEPDELDKRLAFERGVPPTKQESDIAEAGKRNGGQRELRDVFQKTSIRMDYKKIPRDVWSTNIEDRRGGTGATTGVNKMTSRGGDRSQFLPKQDIAVEHPKAASNSIIGR